MPLYLLDMDTVTQMALGAVIGQAVGHKKLGYKAALYGALGGLIPDLDVLATRFLGPYGTWQYHRHITHSLFFAPVVAPLLASLAWRAHKKVKGHYKTYLWVFLLSIFTHPLLDTLTVYGTMLLAPFSNERFTVSAVSIIDPIYTFILFASLLLPISKRFRAHTGKIALTALMLSTVFLAYCLHQNTKAEKIVAAQLAEQNIKADKVSVYTTIFQPHLRRAVVRQTVEDRELLRVGFVSSLNPQPIVWACQWQDRQAFQDMVFQTEGGRVFDWFADHELSFVRLDNRLVVMDARYGTPGPSVFGFWGLEFTLQGELIDVNQEPVFVRTPRDATKEAISELFKASYGLPNNFLLKENQDCPA
jgi:inner membrane protein